MTEEIKSRLNWLYAVEETEKERAALRAIYDLASAWAVEALEAKLAEVVEALDEAARPKEPEE